jgi:hypothetical protein
MFLSWIKDTGFPFWIPDPGGQEGTGSRIRGSERHRIPESDPQHWNWQIIKVFVTQNSTKLSETWSGMFFFIPDLGWIRFWVFSHPGSGCGSRGQKSTGSRIRIRKLWPFSAFTLLKEDLFMYRDDAANLARAQNQTNHNKEDNHVTAPARKSEPDRGMYRWALIRNIF